MSFEILQLCTQAHHFFEFKFLTLRNSEYPSFWLLKSFIIHLHLKLILLKKFGKTGQSVHLIDDRQALHTNTWLTFSQSDRSISNNSYRSTTTVWSSLPQTNKMKLALVCSLRNILAHYGHCLHQTR